MAARLSELVVVARVLGVDLLRRAQAGGRVEGAGGEADRVAAGRLPEQARAALGAEAAPGVGLALGALDPSETGVRGQAQLVARRGRRRPHVTGPPAAFAAVAHHDVTERTVHLEPDGPAQATAGVRQPTSASSCSRPWSRSRPRCTAAMNFVRLSSRVLRMSSA